MFWSTRKIIISTGHELHHPHYAHFYCYFSHRLGIERVKVITTGSSYLDFSGHKCNIPEWLSRLYFISRKFYGVFVTVSSDSVFFLLQKAKEGVHFVDQQHELVYIGSSWSISHFVSYVSVSVLSPVQIVT